MGLQRPRMRTLHAGPNRGTDDLSDKFADAVANLRADFSTDGSSYSAPYVRSKRSADRGSNGDSNAAAVGGADVCFSVLRHRAAELRRQRRHLLLWRRGL